jgi:Ni,Fe-hydrogenase I cytochrome b subunit
MARYVHFAIGALLLSLACASTYVLCLENNTMLQQTSVYHLR